MFYPVKKRPKIPIFSTLIDNDILRDFEGKITAWYMEFFKELLYLRKALLLQYNI